MRFILASILHYASYIHIQCNINTYLRYSHKAQEPIYRLYRYCPWMRGMATSQISCNNGIDKETFVPLHHGKEK